MPTIGFFLGTQFKDQITDVQKRQVPVEIDGKEEEWLISFKNETHNHPTEIEPFGGAATCLGGAIDVYKRQTKTRSQRQCLSLWEWQWIVY